MANATNPVFLRGLIDQSKVMYDLLCSDQFGRHTFFDAIGEIIDPVIATEESAIVALKLLKEQGVAWRLTPGAVQEAGDTVVGFKWLADRVLTRHIAAALMGDNAFWDQHLERIRSSG